MTPCCSDTQTSASSHHDLGMWELPRLLVIAWELHSALSHCPCLGTHYPVGVIPLESEFPMQDELCGGHQAFRRFSATALWFSTRVIYFCFTCCKTEVLTEVFKGVTCDFEMPLTGSHHRLVAAFSAAVHDSIPKTQSKWS